MAKQKRDANNNVVGLTTSGYGDTSVQQDYGHGVGGFVRRVEDVMGGHKEPEVGYQAPREASEPKAPVKVKKVDLAKPSSFKKGGKVEKTGYAKVHKGEVIVPADEVMSSEKKHKKSSKKSKSKKGGKKPHRLHVRGAANGGYIVEHEFKNKPEEPNPQENEEHQIASLDDLKEHIGEHAADMGGNSEEDEEASAAPGGAAPAEMGA